VTAGPVFLDSGIFIAFLDRSDAYHEAAADLFADPPRRWSTSLAVVSETYGWFLHRLGEEAARTLIANQLAGIRKCAELRMRIKVNSVLIPSINGGHMAKVAQEVAAAGAQGQNIMPLIPQAAFSHLPAPTEEEVKAARKECGRYIRQFESCRQCRADAVGTLTEGAGSILEGEISNRQGGGHGHRRLSVETT